MAILLWLRINIGGIEVEIANLFNYSMRVLRINIGGIEVRFIIVKYTVIR